jgi:poly-gamma-glutamate capsule biosynthesis protein CapA/YwtB (metallophosphatase superfamily)
VTLAAVGDVQLGRAWPEPRATLPPNDARDMFTAVTPVLGDADITFGNLETVLKDDGPSSKCGPRSTKCFAFRVPTSFAGALREAGFDVMSIANNHAGDFGQEGRQTTIEALDTAGIAHSGPVGDLASLEVQGLRIGLVAFSTGGGVYRIQDIETARRVVADLDQDHDLVVVSFHGGAEGSAAARVPKRPEVFYGESRGDVHAFAHAVVDAGADLVVGHGPHRLRAMEIYRGRLIAYSLGNFSTWKTFSLRGPLGVSGVLRVTLAPNGVVTEAELVPTRIVDPGRPRLDGSGEAIEIVRDLSRKDFGDPLLDGKGQWKRPEPISQGLGRAPPGG